MQSDSRESKEQIIWSNGPGKIITIKMGQNVSTTVRELDTSHTELRQETSIEVRTTYYMTVHVQAMSAHFHETKSNLLTYRSTMTILSVH